jgi:hypothetical protein
MTKSEWVNVLGACLMNALTPRVVILNEVKDLTYGAGSYKLHRVIIPPLARSLARRSG